MNGQFFIDYVVPHHYVTMFAAAALSMSFNLIGGMVGDATMMFISTPAPCLVFICVARIWTIAPDASLWGNTYTNLISFGLLLSACADVVMNVPTTNPNTASLCFALGLCIFLVVQVIYTIAFTFCSPSVSSTPEKKNNGLSRVPWYFSRGIPFAIYAVFWWITTGPTIPASPIKNGILIYIFLEMTAGWRACARVGTCPANPTMQLFAMFGMILFALCDSMIVYKQFVFPTATYLEVVNMGFYWIGQMMVALSCNEHLTIQDIVDIATTGNKMPRLKAQ
jgi:uncharacterized membrane protein YhhN